MPDPVLTFDHVDLPDFEQQSCGSAKAALGKLSFPGPEQDKYVLIIKCRDGGGSSIAMCEVGKALPIPD